MKSFINAKEIEAALKDAIKEINQYGLNKEINLILVGGTSLVVKYGLKRATSDIDVMARPYVGGLGDILGKRGIQIVSEGIMNLHPDYESRIEFLFKEAYVNVFMLSVYDIAISKISRGFDKDINNIVESDVINHIDISKLKDLYFEATSYKSTTVYWIGYAEKFNKPSKSPNDTNNKPQL